MRHTTPMQDYFRDVSKRLGYSQEKIADMCGAERSTVTKWFGPKEIDIRRYFLDSFRKTLLERQLYDEICFFDKAFRKTYQESISSYQIFDNSYEPLSFEEKLKINQDNLPECLYNAAEVYAFTECFPDLSFLEMIIATARYNNITEAIDKILPSMSQIELLRFQKIYEQKVSIMTGFGLSPELIISNIMEFTCIPQTIKDIPDNIKRKIFRFRFAQITGIDAHTDIHVLLTVMSMCFNSSLVISPHEINKRLTKTEMTDVAISDFIFSYLHDMPISKEFFWDIFTINDNGDDQIYEILLTERGKQIFQCCHTEL